VKRLFAKIPSLRWPAIAQPSNQPSKPLSARLLRMVGIWAASVSELLLIAYVLRWVMKLAY